MRQKFFIGCLLVVLCCTRPCAQRNASITGRVVAAGNPVPGAVVALLRSGISVHTDSSGFFKIGLPGPIRDTLVIGAVNIVTLKMIIIPAKGEIVNLGLIEAILKTANLQGVEITGYIGHSYKSDYSYSATKTQQAVKDVPQAVSTVTSELIKDKMMFNLRDVFENVAGANLYSGYDEYTIRGFRAENPHLVNGLRSYNTTVVNPMLVNIERVEVIKGPVSVLYGNADPGGTINLVTKKPLADKQGSIDGFYGSWNNVRFEGDVTGPLNTGKTLLYRFNAGYENTQSFRKPHSERAFQLAPSFSYVPNSRVQLNADFSISHVNTVLDRGQPGLMDDSNLKNTPISLSVTQPGDYLRETDVSSVISFTYKASNHITLNSAVLSYLTYQRLAEHGIDSYITPDSVNLYCTRKTFNSTTFTISNFAGFTFNTGKLSHEVVAGYDFIKSGIKLDEFNGELADEFGEGSGIVGTFSLLHPQHISMPVNTYTQNEDADEDDEDAYTTQGAYVQDIARYKNWTLLAGLRQEFYRAPPDGDSTGDTKENVLLPRVAVTYAAGDYLSLYATYNNGFDPFEASINTQVYNQALKPIYSRLYEVGAKAALLNNRLFASIALYQLTLDNVAVNANDLSNPDLYVQQGKDRSSGIEVEANGDILPNLSISLSYAYDIAKVLQSKMADEIGPLKENAPRNTSGSWVKYTFTRGFAKNITLQAGHSRAGSRNTLTSGLTLPAYFVFDAGVAYNYNKFGVTLNVYNISNTTYWIGGYNYVSKWPGAPRHYMLNIHYAFR